MDNKIVDFFFLVRPFGDNLNPISLHSCAVHFWVELKAFIQRCCGQIPFVNLQHLAIDDNRDLEQFYSQSKLSALE
jgi:hypothetical protein